MKSAHRDVLLPYSYERKPLPDHRGTHVMPQTFEIRIALRPSAITGIINALVTPNNVARMGDCRCVWHDWREIR